VGNTGASSKLRPDVAARGRARSMGSIFYISNVLVGMIDTLESDGFFIKAATYDMPSLAGRLVFRVASTTGRTAHSKAQKYFS